MSLYYDLHIHSALSPCADDDMTPNNIVNMSIIKGLDIIAVTDHNSCGNVKAVMEVAEGSSLLVIPGMEVETREEVHVLCYFNSLDRAMEMDSIIKNHLPKIKLKSEIFGNQYYIDSKDKIISTEEHLLVTATDLGIEEIIKIVKFLDGVVVPAHIDRQSYSIISNLGFIPKEIDFQSVEITRKSLENMSGEYKNYNIITNSDAHTLGDIAERESKLCIIDKNIENVLKIL